MQRYSIKVFFKIKKILIPKRIVKKFFSKMQQKINKITLHFYKIFNIFFFR